MTSSTPSATIHGTDRRPWGLIVAAVFSLMAFAALYSLGNLRTHQLRYYALITTCMALMLLAYRAWELVAGDDEPRALRVIIISAMLFRVVLIALPPSLSDDLYRYAWDGRVFANGFNPYAHLPMDDELKSLRDGSYDRVAYKDYHSIYPPIVEAGVGAAAWLAKIFFNGSVTATFIFWKLLLCAAECFSLLLIARLLALWKMPVRRLLLYAWHPLPVIEFSGQGHGDALMIAGLLWCVYSLAQAQRGKGMLGYIVAITSRLVPLIFAPVIAAVAGWRRVLMSVAIAMLLGLPFISMEMLHGMYDTVSRMGQTFVFNAFGFWLIYGALENLHQWFLEPYITAFLAVVFVMGLMWISYRSRKIIAEQLPRAMLAVCTLFALVMWNMHPWYFTWGLSLAPFVVSWGWLWIAFISQFTYVHYTPNSNMTLLMIGMLEYGGFILLLVLQNRFSKKNFLQSQIIA